MTDERNFLERTQSWAEKMTGSVPDAGDIAAEFSLYGLSKRAEHLEQLDKELSSKEPVSGETEIRRMMKLHRLRQQMGDTHKKLMSIKR